jgi:hypothetical protein
MLFKKSHLTVIQLHLNIIDTAQNENIFGVAMRQDDKLCCFPTVFDLANKDETSMNANNT